jgi:hypothetical protein
VIQAAALQFGDHQADDILKCAGNVGRRDDESLAGAPKTAVPAGWAASPLSDCQELQSFDAAHAQQWLICR